MYVGVSNTFWLTMYNIANLGGNKFVNGLILGLTECSSGLFAALLMSKMSVFSSFQLCAVLAIVFNFLNQFVVAEGTALSYVTLTVAVLGVGGVYTCIFVLVGIVLPSD